MNLKDTTKKDKVYSTLDSLASSEFIREKWLHVFGSSSSGKTSLLKNYFQNSKANYAFVDCIEICNSQKDAFNLILHLISRNFLHQTGKRSCRKSVIADDASSGNITTSNGFVQEMLKIFTGNKIRFFLILDNAEHLTRCKIDFLGHLLNYDEHYEDNLDVGFLTIVTISKVSYLHLMSKSCFAWPVPTQIHVPMPEEENVLKMLKNSLNNHRFDSQLENLIDRCLELMIEAYSDDLLILKYTTENKLVPFLLSLNKDDECSLDSNTAFKRFKESLKTCADDRIVDLTHTERHLPKNNALSLLALPRNFKLLIAAAFIASFNPANTDARYFLKKSDKKKVSTRVPTKQSELKTQFYRGPKSFLFERILMIYSKLREAYTDYPWDLEGDDMHFTDNLLAQVSTLCEMNIIRRCSDERLLNNVKYKCICPFQTVQQLARSINVDFDVTQFLYNFRS